MPRSSNHNPRTKRELRDRLISFASAPLWRSLSENPDAMQVKPQGSTTIGVDFPDSGHFEIVIRKPRAEVIEAVARGGRIIRAASEDTPKSNVIPHPKRARAKAKA